jgi:hypothetical protein
MANTFRALCSELVDIATAHCNPDDSAVGHCAAVLTRARTELAQPEPEPPTDEALANFSGWFCRNYPGPDTIIHKPEWHAPKVFRAAADALARYARPTIRSVPVSERLPGPEDCLDEGWAWFFNQRIGWRQAVLPVSPGYTHWLPANALPTPEAPTA